MGDNLAKEIKKILNSFESSPPPVGPERVNVLDHSIIIIFYFSLSDRASSSPDPLPLVFGLSARHVN